MSAASRYVAAGRQAGRLVRGLFGSEKRGGEGEIGGKREANEAVMPKNLRHPPKRPKEESRGWYTDMVWVLIPHPPMKQITLLQGEAVANNLRRSFLLGDSLHYLRLHRFWRNRPSIEAMTEKGKRRQE